MPGVGVVMALLTWIFPGARMWLRRGVLSLFWIFAGFSGALRGMAVDLGLALLWGAFVLLRFPLSSWSGRAASMGVWMGAAAWGMQAGVWSPHPRAAALMFALAGAYLLGTLRGEEARMWRRLILGLVGVSGVWALYGWTGWEGLSLLAAVWTVNLGYRHGLFEKEIAYLPAVNRDLLAGMPVGVLVTDARHRVVWQNDIARNMLAPRRVLGRSLEEIFGALPLDAREVSYVLTPTNHAYLVWKVPSPAGYVYMLHPIDAFVQSFREANLRAAQFEKLAALDPLTGVLNRRALYAVLEEAYRRYRQEGVPFALIMVDLDRFKDLNDQMGHEMGDQVLKTLAVFLRHNLRKTDVVARYGGDEFVLVLQGTTLQEGLLVASILKKKWQEMVLPHGVRVQFCMGVVDVQHLPGDVDGALRVVDEYLYKAKATGTGAIVSPLFTR